MRLQARSISNRLGRTSRAFRTALVIAGIGAMSLAAAGCSDDSDDEGEATRSGRLVTTTPPVAASQPSPTTQPAGTLLPADTPAPAVTASSIQPTTAGEVAVIDLVPCSGEAYFEEQTINGGVPALTYVDVPEGTPIVFPFKEGRLRLVDASDGAIMLIYDVEGVGVFSIQAAGSNTLDRLIAHPREGTVIGHFSGVFGEEETDVFEGYQLFAVAGTEELVAVGDTLFAGEPLKMRVTDCIILS